MKARLKVLTSFTLTFTFIVTSLSGIAMFLSPKGRIANWMNWQWLGLSKEQWTDLHIVFVTVMLITGVLHLLVFNWGPFLSYFKRSAQAGMRFKWELVISVVLIPVLWFGTTYRIQPIISVVQLNNWIDQTYETKMNEPPVPHAETFTIVEFADKVLRVSTSEAMDKFKTSGFPANDSLETISNIAARMNVPPSDIFKKLSIAKSTTKSKIVEFSGYGNKTLQEVCSELGISPVEGRKLLEKAGVKEFSEEMNLRAYANQIGKKPINIARILAGEEM